MCIIRDGQFMALSEFEQRVVASIESKEKSQERQKAKKIAKALQGVKVRAYREVDYS
tara:strand:- start:631 stop:801 length:171 start_codon:yes stop_codon:yes gene_type:complete